MSIYEATIKLHQRSDYFACFKAWYLATDVVTEYYHPDSVTTSTGCSRVIIVLACEEWIHQHRSSRPFEQCRTAAPWRAYDRIHPWTVPASPLF